VTSARPAIAKLLILQKSCGGPWARCDWKSGLGIFNLIGFGLQTLIREMQVEQGAVFNREDLPEGGLQGDVPPPMPDHIEHEAMQARSSSRPSTTNGTTTARPFSVASSNGRISAFDVHTDAGLDDRSLYPTAPSLYSPERPFDFVSVFDEATLNSSRSVYAHDFNLVWENGRCYCGSYYMPIDEEELTRQHMVHEAFLKFFNGSLTTIPLHSPRRILDVGTGTGDWAIGMAEQFPQAEVIGTDIAPVQETGCVPSNVWFEYDDAELEWTRTPDSYDLIHLRGMTGAFVDWRFVYQQCFNSLRPGGWIEVLDQHDHHVILSKFAKDAAILQLAKDMGEAALLSGRPRDTKHLQPALLEELGFDNVQSTVYDLSIDPKGTPWGKFWLLALLCSLEASALRLMTKYLGRDPEDVRRMCRAAEEEIKELAEDPERVQYAIYKVKVLVGRKPEAADRETGGKGHAERTRDDDQSTIGNGK
jgi:SAM-dependent methyltransferase